MIRYNVNVKSKDMCVWYVFFQAEDGIRDLVRSRGLGDVYKRQALSTYIEAAKEKIKNNRSGREDFIKNKGEGSKPYIYVIVATGNIYCLLYTSDAADERSSVDLGGRRIIKKKKITQKKKTKERIDERGLEHIER